MGRWLLTGLALVVACGSDGATSILVEVTSDFAVPTEVDSLDVTVTGDATGAVIDDTYDLSGDWPHSVSLRPGEMESGGVRIRVTLRSAGELVARRSVLSAFRSGEEVVVRIHVPRSCGGVVCSDDQDCEDGRCVQLTPMDAGVDAQVDAACTAMDCDDGVNCTVDTCDDGFCRNEPDDSICEEGTTCDPVDGCPARTCDLGGECSDGVACNGAELCVDMVCMIGTPIDCNDDDACTSDRCNEAARGACVHTTVDLDGDGFGDVACPEVGGVPATDCNDGNADVFPDAPEICNGIDDNCDGACDETATCCRGEVGDCTSACGTEGTRVCSASCGWGVCTPPAEACNGIDDDCNGAADDVFACVQGASEACTTSCGSSGMRTCGADCTWSDCVAPAETCNGIDDDCDGAPDDGFSCVSRSTMACMTSCGSTGTITCDAVSCEPGACVPPAEGCTGVDDDCDGNVDETVECSVGEMRSCTTSCGSTGSQSCGAGCTFGTCMAPAETCNGADDDCDGRVDETFTCVPASTGTCTASCGTTGTRTCTAACTWGACVPPVEACNGSDDDCDTMCDETFACCAGSTGSCMTSCGTTGSRTCSAACGWSVCSPPAETCNGVDDDCNGACDDGFACCAGASGSCMTVCGSTGSRTCSGSCAWGACAPPAETCSGSDDDCDGNVDEGFACTPAETATCMTSCGSTGTRTCAPDCTFGACVPPMESCNGVDDDCDAMTDEGCAGCTGCPGTIGVSPPGGRLVVPLGASSFTGSCGGAGSEGTLTFTTTSVRDVFITTHAANGIDTVLYVRNCACGGTERACNDDADGLATSRLRLTNLPAGTYHVFVDTKMPMSGSIPVDVYITTPGAASDRCGNPTFLPAGTTSLTGSTCGFGIDYAPVTTAECSFAGTGLAEDRVYYFYVPTSRTVTFDGCRPAVDYDPTTYIRSSCEDASAAAQTHCNDDGCGGPPDCGGAYRSSLTTTLGPGLYYLFVDGYQDGICDCGTFDYAVSGL